MLARVLLLFSLAAAQESPVVSVVLKDGTTLVGRVAAGSGTSRLGEKRCPASTARRPRYRSARLAGEREAMMSGSEVYGGASDTSGDTRTAVDAAAGGAMSLYRHISSRSEPPGQLPWITRYSS